MNNFKIIYLLLFVFNLKKNILSALKKKIDTDKLTKVADIFSGLAHPIRLEILEFLESCEPVTVGEILKEIECDPTLLTHHLTKMKHIGILDSTKQGRNVFYRLVMPEITNIFDCIHNCNIR